MRSSTREMNVLPCASPGRFRSAPVYGLAHWRSHISERLETDFTIRGGDGARIGMGTANTIIIGHFAVQVVTIHTTPEYAAYTLVDVQPKPGDWDNMVIQVEPRVQKQVNWPPKVVFTNGGRLSIALLMDRWRSGEKVSKITKDIVVS